MIFKCLLLFISYSVLESTALKAPFIKPCTLRDSECITNSAKSALPHFLHGNDELGLAPLEPLTMNQVKVHSGELKVNFKTMNLIGISKVNIISFERNPEKATFKLVIELPIQVFGDYSVDGKLYVLNVEGDGDYEIRSEKIRLVADVKTKYIEKNGKQHLKIKGFDFTYDVIERLTFKFNNLFNGDASKAEPVQQILNESWKELAVDFGKPVITEVIKRVIDIMGKFFLAVPAEELEIV